MKWKIAATFLVAGFIMTGDSTAYIINDQGNNVNFTGNVTVHDWLFGKVNSSDVQNPPWLLSADFQPLWISLNGNTTSNSSINNGNVLITGKISTTKSYAKGSNSISIGGINNLASGDKSAIFGGTLNEASGTDSIIVGGEVNEASGYAGTIIGGSAGIASNTLSVVIGSSYGESNGLYSVVLGGQRNTVSADKGVIIGGKYNTVSNSGNYSVIIGGQNNVITGENSTVIGTNITNPISNSFQVGYNDVTLNVTDNLVKVIGDLNVTANYSMQNLLVYPGTGQIVFMDTDNTNNALSGKMILLSNYTTASPAINTGIVLKSRDDFSSASSASYMINTNSIDIDTYFGAPPAGFGTWSSMGIRNTNTMAGNYVSGFGGVWSGDWVGFKTQSNFIGKISTAAGFNMVTFHAIANVTASVLPSTQLKMIRSDGYFNTPANINQIYGWYHTVNKYNTSNTGSQHGFFVELYNDGLGPLNGPASSYTAYFNPTNANGFNTSLSAGNKFIGFYAKQNTPWSMKDRNSIAFYSELPENSTNYALQSDGASIWLNGNTTKIILGTGKNFNISYDSTTNKGMFTNDVNITNNLFVVNNITSGYTIENAQTFKITAEGGNAIRVNVTETVTKGQILSINTSTANMFNLVPANGDMPVCTVYDASISANTLGWCVTDGRGYMLLTGTNTIGDVCYVSATVAGSADCSATLPAVALHNREIGHTFAVNGTDGITTGILHWN